MKNHFATTINLSETIEIYYKDEFFAQSDNVIELKEQFRGKNLNPVFYFPRCILVGISVRKEKTPHIVRLRASPHIGLMKTRIIVSGPTKNQ